MTDAASAWHWSAAAVAEWLADGTAPRDAIAHDGALRSEPAAVRAAAIALAREAVAGRRRLEFLLGGAAGCASLPAAVHGSALVLARAVERGEMSPADAARQLGVAAAGIDFVAVPAAERRLAAITDVAHRFAVRHSLPDWAARALQAQFAGDADTVAAALATPPPRTLRTNTLRLRSRDELAHALAAEGVSTRADAHAPLALHADGTADLFATASFARGEFEQQDAASQLVAAAVAPPPGGKVLDLCAGVGGKTLALAALLQNRGEVLATDVHERRLADLRERARRAGAGNVRALAIADAPLDGAVAAFAARADRILVDAPCTGTGSWRRRPEGRWALAAADVAALTALQDTLLDRAASPLRPGARLVYATCSLLAVENEARVAAFLARNRGFEVVRLAEILGGHVARPIADATGTFLSLRPDRHGLRRVLRRGVASASAKLSSGVGACPSDLRT